MFEGRKKASGTVRLEYEAAAALSEHGSEKEEEEASALAAVTVRGTEGEAAADAAAAERSPRQEEGCQMVWKKKGQTKEGSGHHLGGSRAVLPEHRPRILEGRSLGERICG